VVVNGGTEDTAATGHDVVVRLDAPQTGLNFLSAAGSNGFNCDAPNANKQVICKGALSGGGDTTITAKYTVTAGAPSDLVMTATVDPDNDIPETIEVINNSKTETTTVFGDAARVRRIDLVAAQLIGVPDLYPDHGTVTMSFTLVNIGDTATTLIRLSADRTSCSRSMYSAFTPTRLEPSHRRFLEPWRARQAEQQHDAAK
jgi:hypothetical protein